MLSQRPAAEALPPPRGRAIAVRGRGSEGRRRAHGLTLIEMLVVTSILAILASIGVPVFESARDAARRVAVLAEIRAIAHTVDAFILSEGHPPDSLTEVGMAHHLDPWGHPYQYLRIDGGPKGRGQARKDHNLVPLNTDYDLYSMGPDGKSVPPLTAKASRDDVIRAQNGSFIGPAADY